MLHVWYIYLHDWAIFRANVGKYTSTMEHMGYVIVIESIIQAVAYGNLLKTWKPSLGSVGSCVEYMDILKLKGLSSELHVGLWPPSHPTMYIYI